MNLLLTRGRQEFDPMFISCPLSTVLRRACFKGYTLTCQTYPCGPGMKVLLNQYDTVYEMQYGQYEAGKGKSGEKSKMFGLF